MWLQSVCQLKFVLTLKGPETGGGAFKVAHGGFTQPVAAFINPAPKSCPDALIVMVCGCPCCPHDDG